MTGKAPQLQKDEGLQPECLRSPKVELPIMCECSGCESRRTMILFRIMVVGGSLLQVFRSELVLSSGWTQLKRNLRKRFSSNDGKSCKVPLPIAIIEHLQRTINLAPAFASLFRATKRLTTIRLFRSAAWADVCYPRAYKRTILRLLDGLSRVGPLPSLVALELRECPFDSIQGDNGEVNKALASEVMRKFTRLELTSQETSFSFLVLKGFPSNRQETAIDLLDVLKSASHLKVLCLSTGNDKILRNFITSATQFEHLVQVEFGTLWTDASIFGPFIAKKLQQLEVLIIDKGYVNEPGSWIEIFEIWRRRRSEMLARRQPLKFVVLCIRRLFDGWRRVPGREIAVLIYQLCAHLYAHLPFAPVNTDVNPHADKK